jgi:hypothetical protein
VNPDVEHQVALYNSVPKNGKVGQHREEELFQAEVLAQTLPTKRKFSQVEVVVDADEPVSINFTAATDKETFETQRTYDGHDGKRQRGKRGIGFTECVVI